MDTYRTVLFVHFLALFVEIRRRRDPRPHSVSAACCADGCGRHALGEALGGNVEKAFPFAILGLFLTGAYMTSDLWTWGTGWIDVAIVSLVVIAAEGRARRRSPHGRSSSAGWDANGPGPLVGRARAMTCDRATWIVSFTNPGIVLGVVWAMTQKPGTVEAIASVVVGYVVGALGGSSNHKGDGGRGRTSELRRASRA